MKIHPTGSRVLVRILSHEFQSIGGIIMPGSAIPGSPETGHGEGGPGTPTIKVVEILRVGQGKLNPATGTFMGSNWKPGEKALMRHGISAVVHIDYVPGRSNEAMVQEDTLVARVEFDADEQQPQEAPPAAGRKPELVR